MSIGKDKVTLFDIDKKTGSYLDTMSMIRKSDIALLRVNGLLGGKIITIKSSEGNFAYNASNKYKKQKQKEQLKRLKDFVAENYPKQ